MFQDDLNKHIIYLHLTPINPFYFLVNEENVASTLVKIIVNLRAHPEELGKISHQAYEMGAVNRQGKIAEVIKDVANRHVA